MLAGRLRYRLEIEGESRVADSQGGYTSTSWAGTGTVWGSVEGISGREQIEGGQVNARALYQVRIRHRDGVKPSHRLKVVSDGRVMNILSVVDPTGRKKELELLCEEQVAQ